jgi:hypothetical protein
MRKLFALALGMLLLMAAAPAAAQSYFFTLTDSSGTQVASFTVNTSPDGNDASSFFYYQPSVSYGGPPVEYLVFYTEGAGGGFAFFDSGGEATVNLGGSQVFGGTTSSPTFQSGSSYELYGTVNGVEGSYTLSITAAVPEPGTWLMMILGFGVVGVALRRKQREGSGGASAPFSRKMAA